MYLEKLRKYKVAILTEKFIPFYQSFIVGSDEEVMGFTALLKEEGLYLLFIAQLKRHLLFEFLPAKLREVCKRDYHLEKAYQLSQMHTITRMLAQVDSPKIFFKGIVLNHWLRTDVYKRSCDIDFLIKEKDIDKTVEQLEYLGFVKKKRVVPYGEFPMIKGKNLVLDVHYNINASSPYSKVFHFSGDDFFKALCEIEIDGVAIPTFSLEMTFIHLCLHFIINHQASFFIQFYELMAFLRNNEAAMDTEKLLELCRKHKVENLLLIVLYMIRSFDPKVGQILFDLLLISPDVNRLRIEKFVCKKDMPSRVVDQSLHVSQLSLSPVVLDSFAKKLYALYGYCFINAKVLYMTLKGEWSFSHKNQNALKS